MTVETDLQKIIDDQLEELEFLRYYRRYIKGIASEGGTDEDYWACEDYYEKKQNGHAFDSISTFESPGVYELQSWEN